ncbi:glycosyl hydrolase family 8 [Alloalcanivorax sp. C16-2]|uniref:glycosyl hydrolase family 8 n=1 Tax=Alloalcanivorax sp. C16-2 TaxID=3390052 RepID=UPI00397100D3
MAVDDDDVARAPSTAFALVLALVWLALSMIGVARAADPGWRAYQTRFISEEGRVVDTGNGNISHTEGQGWGMLMAVYFDDADRFEKLFRWTNDHLHRKVDNLYTWRFEPDADPATVDRNNATDGDLLIAWALELAGRKWQEPRYVAASIDTRNAIRRYLIAEYGGYLVLLPARDGFRKDGYVQLNLSYWVMPALDYFARLEPDGPWRRLMYDGMRLLNVSRFGKHQLPPDWLRLEENGDVSPAGEWPTRFGFEAVRVPLYLYWWGFGAAPALDGVRRFWLQPKPPAWVDVISEEEAEYPLSAGGMAVRALIQGRAGRIALVPPRDEDYYSASLQMLSRIAAAPAPLLMGQDGKKL